MTKITNKDQRLWQRVASTVVRLGLPQPCRPAFMPGIVRSMNFPTVLDLHGFRIHDAYLKTIEYLDEANFHGIKTVIIITGKSGRINSEFPGWLENRSYVRGTTSLNGGGAWRVTIKNS